MEKETITQTVKIVMGKTPKAMLSLPRFRVKASRAQGKRSAPGVEVTGKIVLGREKGCDVRLADASVSGRHAEVELRPSGLWLIDLGSTNGTTINGVAIETGRVAPGDRVRLGSAEVTVERIDDPILVLPDEASSLGSLVGKSERMRLLFGVIRRIAATDLTVLIQGETGTGKELLAHTIHELSSRSAGPLVAVDSASMMGSLANSELFGHEKGAFTGADRLRRGAFERANGGTLFLDEIGELNADVQGRLLRVLEARTFCRLGGETSLSTDVRVIAATHRNLSTLVREEKFREDLFYRLNEVNLLVPPLRERFEDIPLLVERLLEELRPRLGPAGQCTDFSAAAFKAMRQHSWPGNVRELRNYVARVIALARESMIEPDDLQPFESVEEAGAGPQSVLTDGRTTLQEMEKTMIRLALERARGNKARAARELGIPVSTLKDRLKRYGM